MMRLKKMKRISVLALVVALLMTSLAIIPAAPAAAAVRQNDYPIVMVHGLGGWDYVLGIPYWGFLYDVTKDLNSRGYRAIPASVGPVSSNWDRACELYAQLKGGTVDYGVAHSTKHGHARFGRTYASGSYPEWGTVDPATGKLKKIHLIGHSMGGPTVRAITALLMQGSAEERAATPAADLSPLFNGEPKPWIDGCLTIATPHDGSTATYALAPGDNSLLKTVLLFLGSALGGLGIDVYDMHLEQWGLVKQPGESFAAFINRVENSNAWTSTRDFADWDLKPEGAMEMNQWATAQPNVYYFSSATLCTYKNPLTGHYLPRIEMSPMFWAFSGHIGAFTQSSPVPIDKSWWPNDGLVSLCTAAGPHLGSNDQIVNYNGVPQIGKWNYLGVVDTKVDHMQIVGILSTRDCRPMMRGYAELLGSLPE